MTEMSNLSGESAVQRPCSSHRSAAAVTQQTILMQDFDEQARPHIELIDRLRRLGLDQDLDLPCIVVIGDQSSGKSSILEAISGVQLPRGSTMCTRCPLELQLRRTNAEWKATLSYPKDGKQVVEKMKSPNEVGDRIRKAQDVVRGDKAISRIPLTLTVECAQCPDLTMIDLPGIVRVNQEDSVISDIKALIKHYIKRPSTIILCVIPCNTDLDTNEALALAQKEDGNRQRTIGVLTKPDLIERGDENRILQILNNKKQPLKLGYVLVRCRGYQETVSNTSLENALEKEEQFLSGHPVFNSKVSGEKKGTPMLARKLTKYLVDHIKSTLPAMREMARNKRDRLLDEQRKLGDGPPSKRHEKQLYIMEKLENMWKSIQEALTDGIRVPGKVLSSSNVYVENPDELCNTSHLWRMLFKWFATEVDNLTSGNLNMVSGNLNINKIQQRITTYRSTELPRFPSFKVFEHLVRDHVKDYRELADECLQDTNSGVRKIIDHICEFSLSGTPALQQYMENHCRTVLDRCFAETRKMVEREIEKELLVYSQDKTYLRELQRVEERSKESETRSGSDNESTSSGGLFFQVAGRGDDDDEDRHNARLMQKLIEVYLGVANRRLVDNVPNTIRLCLYLDFSKKFRSEMYSILASDEVFELVREDPEASRKREEISNSIERLSKCLEEFSKHA